MRLLEWGVTLALALVAGINTARVLVPILLRRPDAIDGLDVGALVLVASVALALLVRRGAR